MSIPQGNPHTTTSHWCRMAKVLMRSVLICPACDAGAWRQRVPERGQR